MCGYYKVLRPSRDGKLKPITPAEEIRKRIIQVLLHLSYERLVSEITETEQGSVNYGRGKRLWSSMSMIDLSSLSVINNHCKSARSLDRSSPDLFGGLPVVILMGDFCQFPPVRGQPLWKMPQSEAEHVGKLIWQQFNQVIVLDEQMRQVEDESYRNLLQHARTGTLTYDDMAVLNSRAIESLTAPNLKDATAITRLNSLRQVINRPQIERFARSKLQKIYIFPALHTRTKSSSPTIWDFTPTTFLVSRTRDHRPIPGTLPLHSWHANHAFDKRKHSRWFSQRCNRSSGWRRY